MSPVEGEYKQCQVCLNKVVSSELCISGAVCAYRGALSGDKWADMA